MKSMKGLERKKTKLELIEESKKYKNRAKLFLIILIIICAYFAYFAYGFVGNALSSKNKLTDELNCQIKLDTYFKNQTNISLSQFKKESCEESSFTQSINVFFDKFLRLDKPWIIKLFIFLGIVYLIQITFALVMDILEVLMLVFVIIKRIYKWVVSLFKKKSVSS